ncbi:2OG-Fe dioxygenase family protein [Mycobacterium sp. B14F4]|uniref:2OG-Fe dioxygenase family protein n=1 Tax=Mycobacterium sp. B14F4 TaxID=3153565 RepID=UPI00325CA733
MTLAQHQLATDGFYLMAPAELNGRLGVGPDAWHGFSRHWDELSADPYAAELGTRRLRRYGHFLFTPGDGSIEPRTHDAFVQPEDSNPLYVGHERHFEPLTDAFTAEPLVRDYLRLLGAMATMLADVPRWSVKVTPFRVLATADGGGEATPEGLHRDGVTLVTSLLVGRDNAEGGESSVCDMAGRRLLSITLTEPGTLLLGDDRRGLHGVTPIRPRDPSRPARRDVLVVTFAPSDP